MLSRIPGKPDVPLFKVPGNKGKGALMYPQLSKQLKKWMKKLTGSDKGWTLHGLRRGGATWCFEINIGTEAIRLMGSWASDAYKMYLDLGINKRIDTMTKITDNINQLMFNLN